MQKKIQNDTLFVSDKAALRGEPSYVWRSGQERRLALIKEFGEEKTQGFILENGVGVGEYLKRLSPDAKLAVGLDVDFDRVRETKQKKLNSVLGVGEELSFPDNTFDLVISNEVIEHVMDDGQAIKEILRVLKPEGRLILFCPNRWYPFETHGIYWKGKYKFGNKPLVNYLPDYFRNKLAPHVRAYRKKELRSLFSHLNVQIIHQTIIYGAYDNIEAKIPWLGKILKKVLYFLEKTAFRVFGLSHFWVIEKKQDK